MILTVKCPKCNHNQKCNPKGEIFTDKIKRCVYCGKSFKIHPSINESRIVKALNA